MKTIENVIAEIDSAEDVEKVLWALIVSPVMGECGNEARSSLIVAVQAWKKVAQKEKEVKFNSLPPLTEEEKNMGKIEAIQSYRERLERKITLSMAKNKVEQDQTLRCARV